MDETIGFRVTFSSTLDQSVTLTTLLYIYIYINVGKSFNCATLYVTCSIKKYHIHPTKQRKFSLIYILNNLIEGLP